MNIFNFLVALVVCITLAFIVYWITKHPISVKIISAKETPKISLPQEIKSQDAHEDNNVLNGTVTASMDAVIGAVNKLMGVEEDEINAR